MVDSVEKLNFRQHLSPHDCIIALSPAPNLLSLSLFWKQNKTKHHISSHFSTKRNQIQIRPRLWIAWSRKRVNCDFLWFSIYISLLLIHCDIWLTGQRKMSKIQKKPVDYNEHIYSGSRRVGKHTCPLIFIENYHMAWYRSWHDKPWMYPKDCLAHWGEVRGWHQSPSEAIC